MSHGKKYVVELEHGVWLCDEIEGDPGRTCVLEHATRYQTISKAEAALTQAKKYRSWVDHSIRPLFIKKRRIMNTNAILEAASKNGTVRLSLVRLSIESSSKQAKLSFWTNSHHATGVLELQGELEDVLTLCALKLGIDVDGNILK
jgi:hypothetical protein